MAGRKIDISALEATEKLNLTDEWWCSIRDEDWPPLTRAQREKLDRRINEIEEHPHEGVPWEQVLERLRRRP